MDFKVFTLNCWGLAVVSKDRKARIRAIADVICESNYDVVCLQEVWVDSDFQLIANAVASVLPYSHYFYSGVAGSGVCILSKHIIEEIFYHQWAVNGYIHKLQHGDWFGGKGVGLCKLNVNNYKINVYSAHLHAEYNRDCDEYQAHRVLQAYDTAQFISLTSGSADLVVLAGDLNTEPGDLSYRLLLDLPGLRDAFSEWGQTTEEKIATNESLQNSYTSSSLIKNKVLGKRIDYILYHPGKHIHVELKNYDLPLPTRVPNENYSYSDHEAVTSTLYINRKDVVHNFFNEEANRVTLEESVSVCNDALQHLMKEKVKYLLFTVFVFFLLLLVFCVSSPVGYVALFYILKLLLSILMLFSFLMATIWNKIEKHGILSGKLAMEVTLKYLQNKYI